MIVSQKWYIFGRLFSLLKTQKTYRISSINSRGHYSFLDVRSAASIWGRPLIKGGYYYESPQKLREIAPKMDYFRYNNTMIVQTKL